MPRNFSFVNFAVRRYSSAKLPPRMDHCLKETKDHCQAISELQEFGFEQKGVLKASPAAQVMSAIRRVPARSPYSHCQSTGARAARVESAFKYLEELKANFKDTRTGGKEGGNTDVERKDLLDASKKEEE